MKTTTTTARRLLRESNPVPDDAFADAADGQTGQAALAAIVTSPVAPQPPGTRSRWRAAFPAAAISAAVAGGLAVALILTAEPGPGTAPRGGQSADGSLVSLVADLTAHPPAHAGDAVAVFRALAAAAAAQPAPALGPVEYSESKEWGLDLGQLHYNLSYRSHEVRTDQNWLAPDGSSLSVSTYPGGKVPPGIIPVARGGPSKQGQAYFAWYDPARLPAGETALRHHLLSMPGGVPQVCRPGESSKPGPSWCQAPVDAIVTNSLDLMGSEPLPPAVRASLLRLLADMAITSGPTARFVDMGTVTDRAGHTAVAIGYETPAVAPEPVSLQVLVFSPATGALLGEEYAYCKGQVGSPPVNGSCFPASYGQILQIKAVPAIPATPAPSASTSPG